MAMGAASIMKAGCAVGPTVAFERGTRVARSRVGPVQATHLVPATFQRPSIKQRKVAQRFLIRAQANSRDASKPGSSGPGEIKRTVEKEVGVHAGKMNGPGDGEAVSSASKHRENATAAGVPNASDKMAEQMKRRETDHLKEVSEAVAGSSSYAVASEKLRHEPTKPSGPIRSEVLERAAAKEDERKASSQGQPFKEPQEDQKLNLNPEKVKKSVNFKALAAILVIVFLAFGLAPVWSPIVGKVLTPFFQLVGAAVAVKFFVTDFLRADKRKELYKKGEKLKEDVAGS